MKRVTELAHEAVRAVVRAGERVIDGTVGNGHDTLFLAGLVGGRGKVYGFDIQEEAIARTRERLREAGVPAESLILVHGGHQSVGRVVREPVAAAMFNLGYLPGGDREVTTCPGSTVEAIEQVRLLLRPGGVLSVVCYRGHPGGAEEAGAVCRWADQAKGCEVGMFGRERGEDGPFLVVVTKAEESLREPLDEGRP